MVIHHHRFNCFKIFLYANFDTINIDVIFKNMNMNNFHTAGISYTDTDTDTTI